MGFFDKARQLLGLGGSKDEAEEAAAPAKEEAHGPAGRAPHGRDRKDRPALALATGRGHQLALFLLLPSLLPSALLQFRIKLRQFAGAVIECQCLNALKRNRLRRRSRRWLLRARRRCWRCNGRHRSRRHQHALRVKQKSSGQVQMPCKRFHFLPMNQYL